MQLFKKLPFVLSQQSIIKTMFAIRANYETRKRIVKVFSDESKKSKIVNLEIM